MKVKMNVDMRQNFQRFLATSVFFGVCSTCPFQDLPLHHWVPTFSDWASQFLSSFPTSSSPSGFSQSVIKLRQLFNQVLPLTPANIYNTASPLLCLWDKRSKRGINQPPESQPHWLLQPTHCTWQRNPTGRKKRKNISQMSWGQVHKSRKHF